MDVMIDEFMSTKFRVFAFFFGDMGDVVGVLDEVIIVNIKFGIVIGVFEDMGLVKKE